MAKKSKSDRWVRGWATRRAKQEARKAGLPAPAPANVSPLWEDSKSLPKSWQRPSAGDPPPTGTIAHAGVDGWEQPLRPCAPEESRPDIVGLVLAAARKRNGRAEVDSLLADRHLAERNELAKRSAAAADSFQRATLESHRDEVICGLIAEFEAARGFGSANIWKISHRFWAHVVNALKDAGYSAHGRANRAVGVINQEPRG